MTAIKINCDRCAEPVEGTHTPGGTGGFYVVSPGGPWAKYGFPLEHFVCDACVQAMPLYRKRYGGSHADPQEKP